MALRLVVAIRLGVGAAAPLVAVALAAARGASALGGLGRLRLGGLDLGRRLGLCLRLGLAARGGGLCVRRACFADPRGLLLGPGLPELAGVRGRLASLVAPALAVVMLGAVLRAVAMLGAVERGASDLVDPARRRLGGDGLDDRRCLGADGDGLDGRLVDGGDDRAGLGGRSFAAAIVLLGVRAMLAAIAVLGVALAAVAVAV